MRFSEILLAGTVVTGGIWLLDSLFFRHKRMMSFSKKEQHEPWWVEYSRAFFPILLIVFILRSFLAEPFRIPSGSMRPTLVEGDFILVNKYNYGLRLPITGTPIINIGAPKRGDVIVFKHVKNGESIDMIKRVVGLPGDHITYKDKTVYVNGKPAVQDFIAEEQDITRGGSVPVRHFHEQLGEVKHDIFVHPSTLQIVPHYAYSDETVPKDSYFVMGDNRDNSEDSRVWGFVKDADIQGRAFLIWMSLNHDKEWRLDSLLDMVRWSRIGTKIK